MNKLLKMAIYRILKSQKPRAATADDRASRQIGNRERPFCSWLFGYCLKKGGTTVVKFEPKPYHRYVPEKALKLARR